MNKRNGRQNERRGLVNGGLSRKLLPFVDEVKDSLGRFLGLATQLYIRWLLIGLFRLQPTTKDSKRMCDHRDSLSNSFQ